MPRNVFCHVRIGLACRLDTLQAALISDQKSPARQGEAQRYSEGRPPSVEVPFVDPASTCGL